MTSLPPVPAATVVVTGEGTADRYAVLDVAAPAGAATPHHVHRQEDLAVIVITGALELVEDGRRRRLAAGDHALLRANVPWRARAEQDSRVLAVLLPAGAERLAAILPEVTDGEDRAALLAAAGIHVVPTGGPAELDR
jgi:quercetin dioxygenase-like cupin family protein